MRDAGMPAFVAMVDDGTSKPYQVMSFEMLNLKVGTLLLYDKLLGEGRSAKYAFIHNLACLSFNLTRASRVHEATLFVASTLGIEDPESNYGTKVAVKIFNKPFQTSTREVEVIRKTGKQKFFIKYHGYIHTPDHRLGMDPYTKNEDLVLMLRNLHTRQV